MAAISATRLRLGFWTLLLVSGYAQAQPIAAPVACPLQPSYPLPTDPAQLRTLADRLDELASDRGCLKEAGFHAWRGAVLISLGRAAEAAEPLERALLIDPDLPGATLDLAQALAVQGDQASATALLEGLRARPDLPAPVRDAIDRRAAAIAQARAGSGSSENGWQSRWQVSALAGHDSNLNNGPATTEVTLTFPQGNQVLSLDPSARPRAGSALMSSAQWQGLKAAGESVWVLQGEVRSRATHERETNYEQADLAASWLQAPAAPRQWVVRASASYLRFGGVSLLEAGRLSLQHQWEPYSLPWISGVLRMAGSCRPSAGAEIEYRRYPTSSILNGQYEGAAAGLICRADADAAPAAAGVPAAVFNLQARIGNERPADQARPGGSYRRSEIRAQWEAPFLSKGKIGLQWAATIQRDTDPYSQLLGNVPRKIFRNDAQVEASWPIGYGFSLVGSAQAGRQRSNLNVFDSKQRSLYMGLRRDLM